MQGSTNVIEIAASVEDVARVLRDPTTYPDWLVGAQTIRSIDENWPAIGSKFHHRIGVGPLTVPGSTSVLKNGPDQLELGAGIGPFGEARVRFTWESVHGATRLTLEEEPRRGIARHAWKLLRSLVNLGLWGRNEASLASLRDAVIDRTSK